jgi:hypothetical protein
MKMEGYVRVLERVERDKRKIQRGKTAKYQNATNRVVPVFPKL